MQRSFIIRELLNFFREICTDFLSLLEKAQSFDTWNYETGRYLKNKVINLSESSKFKLRKKLKIIIPNDSSKSVTFLAPPEFCYRY